MRPVKSAPPSILNRVDVAKRSIENSKKHAAERGFRYVEVYGPLGFTEDAVRIFETLASHPEMEWVWGRLAPVFDDTKRCPDTWSFAHACYHIRGSWKYSPKRTQAEHKEHFEKIAIDLMDVVYRILTEPEFGTRGNTLASASPVDMIKDDGIKLLMEEIDANPIDGIYIKNEAGAVSFARSMLFDVVPGLHDYAAWLATEANRIAAQQSISERPHRESAERTFFIKHLSRWFRDNFEKPMHEVVAGVASALFDEAVTADTVRKAAISDPEVSFPFKRGKLPLAK